MTFGSYIYLEFCFKSEVNKGENVYAKEEASKNIPYCGGSTCTGEAVKCACDNILNVIITCGLPKEDEYNNCPAPINIY